MPNWKNFIMIFDSLHGRSVDYFEIELYIGKEELIQALVNLFEANTTFGSIALYLEKEQDVIAIFKSLRNNYCLRDLNLLTENEVSEEVIHFADEFRKNRTCIIIRLTTQVKRYRIRQEAQVFYP